MLPRKFLDQLEVFFVQSGLTQFVFEKRKVGLFSYKESFNILRKDAYSNQYIQAGLVAYTDVSFQGFGSTSRYTGGCYFSLSAVGCRGVNFELLVGNLSKYLIAITRIDIAVDWFDGLVNFELVEALYYEGSFISGGRSPRFYPIAPKVMHPKTGELSQIGSNTFYVGKRGGAKLFRGYEKGLQLFSFDEDCHPFPDWFRCEVELRNKQCEIPLDVVSNLDGALLGAYPNFFRKIPPPNHIDQTGIFFDIVKAKYKTPADQVNLEHFIYWCKESYGGLFNVLANEIGFESDVIVDLLMPDDLTKKPKRLLFPSTVSS
jgi:phage replication initiation protein